MPAPSAGLDGVALAGYLGDVLGRPVDPAELTWELLAGGHSNLTYAVAVDGRELVLRRAPIGAHGAGSHDMGREHRIYAALIGTDVPVPAPLALCTDESVLGAPFLLMERVEGGVVRTRAEAEAIAPDVRLERSVRLVETLASIHSVDHEAVGLGGLGRGAGFLERQVRRWVGQAADLASVPLAVGELAALVAGRPVPRTARLALVHGDYRIDNVMWGRDGEIRAVLDWEMATVGDPLADLGLLLVYWGEPADRRVSPEYEVMEAAGFLDRAEVVDTYVRATGADVTGLGFHVLLAHLKMAVVVQGIVERHDRSPGPDDRAERLRLIPAALAARGLDWSAEAPRAQAGPAD